jgi:hypothetical protein
MLSFVTFYYYITIIIIIIIIIISGVRLCPIGTAATTGLLYQPQMTDGDCGAIGGMKVGKGNRSTRIKPASMPFVHHKSYIT